MAKPPRDHAHSDSNTYFITARYWNGVALFQTTRVVDLLLATILNYRDAGKFLVHEFVVMPNHLHMLITNSSGTTLERAIQFIKGGFSFRAGKELGMKGEIWQRGYIDHRIQDADDYSQHRSYIHQNPVRARLANSPEEYPYSSASPGFKLDPVPQGLKPPNTRGFRHD
jgi:putative transposase